MREPIHILSRWSIAISLVLMALFGFASNQLLDEDTFAELFSGALDDADVRQLLATKAVDVAIDASDVDAILADALPEDVSLAATPALELSKPAIAQAGATLLGVDQVGDSIEAAARSAHRQASSAIVAAEETDVVLNALPVLVVVADEIAGDVGARAAVGLNLPESATSINLGSNQSPAWAAVRIVSYLAAVAVLAWLVSVIAYFVTARRGRRLQAARRLGWTFARAGVVTVIIATIIEVATGVGLEVLLSPGDALSFGGLSVGGATSGGGVAVASVLFAPLVAAARRTIYTGLVIVAVTYLFGGGHIAVAFREAVQTRDLAALRAAVQVELPRQVRNVQFSLTAGLALILLAWPAPTLRVALTLTAIVAIALAALGAAIGSRAPAPAVRDFFAIPKLERRDINERTEDASTRRRWLAAVGLVLAIIWPTYTVSGFIGLTALLGGAAALIYRWEARIDHADVLALAELEDDGWSLRRKLAIAGVVALGLAAAVFGGGTSNPASASSLALSAPAECNGHAGLCDRPLDEIAFAGTHNSMSSSELGWELANHGGAIPAQLEGGIRALLIDVQYWPQGGAVSDLDLDPEAAEIAARVLAIDEPPQDGLWMCHKLCQLGGTPFSEFLADLRVFLETNPDEVLIIVIQDEAPASDIVAAINNARVDEYVFTHDPDEPWPTLGEMIGANERVVFFAENETDGSPWYQTAFDGNVSETGFRYSVVEDFDCAANRGDDDGDFFMINHWVETGLPVPDEADRVNSREVLMQRIDECQRTRGVAPGIIAVNFWERGDLLSVVDEVNGIAAE